MLWGRLRWPHMRGFTWEGEALCTSKTSAWLEGQQLTRMNSNILPYPNARWELWKAWQWHTMVRTMLPASNTWGTRPTDCHPATHEGWPACHTWSCASLQGRPTPLQQSVRPAHTRHGEQPRLSGWRAHMAEWVRTLHGYHAGVVSLAQSTLSLVWHKSYTHQ